MAEVRPTSTRGQRPVAWANPATSKAASQVLPRPVEHDERAPASLLAGAGEREPRLLLELVGRRGRLDRKPNWRYHRLAETSDQSSTVRMLAA
jgi:hypothetical protein